MSYGERLPKHQRALEDNVLPLGAHVLEPEELDLVAEHVFLIEELVAGHFDTKTEEDAPRDEWIRLQQDRRDTRLEILDSITRIVIMARRYS